MIAAAGWVGALLVSSAYLAFTWRGPYRWYHPLNAVGGIGLAANALANRALPSATVNALWAAIAISGLVRGRDTRKRELP